MNEKVMSELLSSLIEFWLPNTPYGSSGSHTRLMFAIIYSVCVYSLELSGCSIPAIALHSQTPSIVADESAILDVIH